MRPAEVQDKPTEIGIKLNNVLTAITIAILVWIGTSILSVKEEVGNLRTDIAVGQTNIEHLEEKLEEHINNKAIHTMGHVHINED